MQDHEYNSAQKGTGNGARPTDLPPKTPPIAPEKSPSHAPSDLPLPRHRPGEPLMYDPPASGIETFPLTFPDHEKLL